VCEVTRVRLVRGDEEEREERKRKLKSERLVDNQVKR